MIEYRKLIALLCLLTPPGDAPAATDTRHDHADVVAGIDEILERASRDGSGFAVVIEIGDELVLEKGYGLAIRDGHVPFTPDTVAQVGSLTKQFTATALLDLVEKGRVELDAPVSRYIPEIPATAAAITPRQLLTHSSGLPEYCGPDFEAIGRSEFVRRCLAMPLAFKPGTRTAYSNVGYSAIALIIETASGRPYADYLRDEILKPAGLLDTGYFLSNHESTDLAHGYLDGQDRGNIRDRISALDGDWWNLKGNGGMQASATDMYRWYRALNEPGTLSPRLRQWLTAPHTDWNDGVAEGFGWFFRSEDGSAVDQMSHAGSDGVFFSYYWHRIEEDAFMYFVGNSGEQSVLETLREVLDALRTHLSAEKAAPDR